MSTLFFDAGPPPAGHKVMLATTAYDSPDASYTFSIARSREALHRAGVQTAYLLLQGNCHVDDARNTVVREFLKSDCDDLIFLDADVSWDPQHLITLCGHDCDLVGGVYPYRRDTGMDGMPVRNKAGCFEPDKNGLIEVDGLPTGFLRIRRVVLETLAESAVTFSKDNGDPIPLIFERDIYEGGRRGGDIGFCMKWQAAGGKLYASANLRLGHCGKVVLKDSLAATLRRQMGTSLRHVVDMIRAGDECDEDYAEALKCVGNPWGAQTDVLSAAVEMARKVTGPILEAGSGLSTVLMAAATDQTVWCIEHHPVYAAQTECLAVQAGVRNIALVTCPLKDSWYFIAPDLPAMPRKFALGVIDGPPRLMGDRMKFFDIFGDRCTAFLADDADDRGYVAKLQTWADANGKSLQVEGRAAVML